MNKDASTIDHAMAFVRQRYELILIAIIFLVSFLTYSQFFGISYPEFDTIDKITVHKPGDFKEIISIFTTDDNQYSRLSTNYRPMAALAWWTLISIFGMKLQYLHYFNFIINALNSVLIFILLGKLFRLNQHTNPKSVISRIGLISAFIASLVFALNPMNLMSVLLISRLPELLVVFGLLSSLIFMSDYLKSRRLTDYMLSIVCCTIGIFSKPTGMIIPFILLFLCFLYTKPIPIIEYLRKQFMIIAPFLIILFIYVTLMLISLGGFESYTPARHMPSHQIVMMGMTYLIHPFSIPSMYSGITKGLNPLLDILMEIGLVMLTSALLVLLIKRKDKTIFIYLSFILLLDGYIVGGYMTPWYSYSMIAFFSLIVFMLFHSLLKHANGLRETGYYRLFYTILLTAVTLLIIVQLSSSPMFKKYNEAGFSAGLSNSYLNNITSFAKTLPKDSTIFTVNTPILLLSRDMSMKEFYPIVSDASLKAWLDYALPYNKIVIFSLSELILNGSHQQDHVISTYSYDKDNLFEKLTKPDDYILNVAYSRQRREEHNRVYTIPYPAETLPSMAFRFERLGKKDSYIVIYNGMGYDILSISKEGIINRMP